MNAAMSEIDAVANWHSKQVISWFKGLDDSLQCYIPNLEEAEITGAQLLALDYDDLDNLGIDLIGHQELVLEATQLLKNLHFNLDIENLQSRSLDLNCQCRTLRSQISSRRRNDIDAMGALRRGSSLPMLGLACDVLDSSKLLVMWLDRPPFFSNPEARKIRSNVVRLSYELSTMVQQTVFACVIEDAVSTICSEMEVLMNQLIVSNDPMTIQPSSLEVAHLVNRDPSSGLGLFIKATFEGHHVITGTKEGSISSRIRRITPGDEVVAVGSQTVIGWQLSKLVTALKETPTDISLTLKKRPHFSTSANAVTPTSRRAHQERVLTVPPPISPIQKVADSRKNSIDGMVEGDSVLSDLRFSTSKENLASPRKTGAKKRKKLKKEKAKSSSNILVAASENHKKSSSGTKRNSVNSFESSLDGNNSLRSASSSEAVLSVSAGHLSSGKKNFDIRRSLEKVLRPERRDSAENVLVSREPKKKQRLSEGRDAKTKDKKGKDRKNSRDLLPTFDNDVLEQLRQKRLHRRDRTNNSTSKKSDSETQLLKSDSADMEPPKSPLDFFAIPPPPEAPYTPRAENVLQLITDDSLTRSVDTRGDADSKASESPNSLMDIEHRRRFTVIGSEQMDERWYSSLLAEVNAKRSKVDKRASARHVLERLDETTASEDSVFTTSQSLLSTEENSVVKRLSKPKLRHRPLSMPPDYYSPAKLLEYRAGQISRTARSRGSLPKMDEVPSPFKPSRLSPVAHQVDKNGVKKLAPLNCSVENIALSAGNSTSNTTSLENQQRNNLEQSPNKNNNNNIVAESSTSSKLETSPTPRPSLLADGGNVCENIVEKSNENMPIGGSKTTGERLQFNIKPERHQSTDYVGLLQVKTQSAAPTEPVRQTKRNEIGGDATTPTGKLAIADELSRYFLRKKGGVNSMSDPFSPVEIPSPAWWENDAFAAKSPPASASLPARSPAVALTPPVAKPRNKLRSSAAALYKSSYPMLMEAKVAVNKLSASPLSSVERDKATKVPASFSSSTQKDSATETPPSASSSLDKRYVLQKPTSTSIERGTSVDFPASPVTSLGKVSVFANSERKLPHGRPSSPAQRTDKSLVQKQQTSKSPHLEHHSARRDQEPSRGSKSKSMDASELLNEVASSNKPARRKSDRAAERSPSNLSQSSPVSRGSYVAAIDGGFVFGTADPSYQTATERDGSRRDSDRSAIKVVDGVEVKLRKSTSKSNTGKKGRLKLIDQLKASPEMRSQRRISCRDLGSGECDGWLWKKKTNTSSALTSKWSKRWVVLKDGALYCYHTEEDEKAESYISLPGYHVTPAPECKRRFAFRVAHPLRKTFYFASDRQIDMSRWMNKMGLVAIGYAIPAQGKENHKGSQTNDEQYFSESESEDASNVSQSGTESSTPNSSPEKPYKVGSASASLPMMLSNSQKSAMTPRHVSTQPDLNRSARFPKNKSKEIMASTAQNMDLLQRNDPRNRSQSEAAISTSKPMGNERTHGSSSSASLSAQDSSITIHDGYASPPFASPMKKPAVMADQRKHKANDTRRKQFVGSVNSPARHETVQLLESGGLMPSQSEEEQQHLLVVAAKKAEEVANRVSSASSLSSTSAENIQDAGSMFVKAKAKGTKSPTASSEKMAKTQEHNNSDSRSPKSLVVRREIAGPPKLKGDSNTSQLGQPEPANGGRARNDSSIDDLCKALQDAEVDIHGVSRRTTLRRKMTILAKDPGKNELMLKKRALQRQIKALEGELEYYKLLDEQVITSDLIHDWINQHPSLVAELGTIRRMSKRRKTPVAVDRGTRPEENNGAKEAEYDGSRAACLENTDSAPETSAPVPAKRWSKPRPELLDPTPSFLPHQRKHSDSAVPPRHTPEQSGALTASFPKVRPRSCAISTHDVNRIKPRNKTPSPGKERSPSLSPNPRPYLETDL